MTRDMINPVFGPNKLMNFHLPIVSIGQHSANEERIVLPVAFFAPRTHSIAVDLMAQVATQTTTQVMTKVLGLER
jgi:hypothetical protein